MRRERLLEKTSAGPVGRWKTPKSELQDLSQQLGSGEREDIAFSMGKQTSGSDADDSKLADRIFCSPAGDPPLL